jgi:hypothetical protein
MTSAAGPRLRLEMGDDCEYEIPPHDVVHFDRHNDVTLFVDRSTDFGKSINRFLAMDRNWKTELAYDGTAILLQPPKAPVECRMCLASCNKGLHYSITLRLDRKDKDIEGGPLKLNDWKIATIKERSKIVVSADEHVLAIRQMLDWVNDSAISKASGEPSGLVIFAGATGSAKSTIATTFTLDCLRRRRESLAPDKGRLPHLVTFEDPIEKWSFTSDDAGDIKNDVAKNPALALNFGFCITARQLRVDCQKLGTVLRAALRQTPAVLHIGEVRDAAEWPEIISFAATGHLTVATMHAESIQAALARVFQGCDANTPATRRRVASSIRAIIHLRRVEKLVNSIEAPSRPVIFPSLWSGTSRALNALVSTGLSAMVPAKGTLFSRLEYVNKVIELATAHPINADDCEQLRKRALAMDIEELNNS